MLTGAAFKADGIALAAQHRPGRAESLAIELADQHGSRSKPYAMTKAMCAGARGYLLKGATKEEILRAVTAVADGQAIFGPAVAQRVLARLGTRSADEDPFPQLTPREHDVLRLMAQGLSNSVIAACLGLSLKTVNNNISSTFTNLNVASRTEAAILARDRGFGPA